MVVVEKTDSTILVETLKGSVLLLGLLATSGILVEAGFRLTTETIKILKGAKTP